MYFTEDLPVFISVVRRGLVVDYWTPDWEINTSNMLTVCSGQISHLSSTGQKIRSSLPIVG